MARPKGSKNNTKDGEQKDEKEYIEIELYKVDVVCDSLESFVDFMRFATNTEGVEIVNHAINKKKVEK